MILGRVMQNMDEDIIEQEIPWLHKQAFITFIYVVLKAMVYVVT